MPEYDVYDSFIKFLESRGWKIICASPPAGTDPRFRKGLIPRRELGGSDRGPRDEVDIIATKDNILLLVELKPTLRQSLHSQNAMGESDYIKLKRILGSFSPGQLSSILSRATGITLPLEPLVIIGLVTSKTNDNPPSDILVGEVQSTNAIFVGPLSTVKLME